MFGDSNEPFSHVRLLARLARIAHSPGALDRLRAGLDARDVAPLEGDPRRDGEGDRERERSRGHAAHRAHAQKLHFAEKSSRSLRP